MNSKNIFERLKKIFPYLDQITVKNDTYNNTQIFELKFMPIIITNKLLAEVKDEDFLDIIINKFVNRANYDFNFIDNIFSGSWERKVLVKKNYKIYEELEE